MAPRALLQPRNQLAGSCLIHRIKVSASTPGWLIQSASWRWSLACAKLRSVWVDAC